MFGPNFPGMSLIAGSVVTTSGKRLRNVCPPPKNAIPLRCDLHLHSQKLINSINIKIIRIMTQKDEMSARALTMEEMENVNGGKRHIPLHGVPVHK